MIVLVVQVLIGFECRAAFEPGFERLPDLAQTMKMVSFGLLIVTLALILAIPAFHRIAEEGQSTPRCETFLRWLMTVALLPFAVAVGLDVGIATLSQLGTAVGLAVTVATAGVALFCWYALGWFTPAADSHHIMNEQTEPTPLQEKIKQVLTECRIVLPGTQAFLGFQLSAFLTDSFAKLPRSEQLLHLSSLALVATSGILLMTPPAYHRIKEKGEMTERFLRLASIILVCAMLPLALGISVDFYVVLSKVTHAPGLALALAGAAFLAFAGCWFVFPYASRSRKTSEIITPADAHPKAA